MSYTDPDFDYQDPTWVDIGLDPTHQRMRGIANHGNTPFDVPFISQIDGNLWQGGCQVGLILPEFIDHLVSLYPWEGYKKTRLLNSELIVKMYDSEDQGFDEVLSIARWVNQVRRLGPTLVHCQAGLNRSSLVAATALVLDGYTGPEAITKIRDSRSPACLCNPAFEQRLLDYEDWID